MKKLLIVATVIAGLAFVVGGNTAEANHPKKFKPQHHRHGHHHGHVHQPKVIYYNTPYYVYPQPAYYQPVPAYYGHRHMHYRHGHGGIRIQTKGFGMSLRF